MRKNRWLLPGILVLFAGIILLFFHRPVRIVDVLSGLPVPGYEVHVSLWRVLFEPVAGPLLFYLRADQPVEEFLILFVWAIGLLLLLSLGSAFRRRIEGAVFGRDRVTNFFRSLSAGILRWLVRVPVVLILWFALMMIIIFMPLPSNTIRSSSGDSVLFNAHSHTHFSHDGLITPEGMQKWHKRNGFSAFFITEHNVSETTLKLVGEQDEGRLPASPVILPGEEFSGSNHILLLGTGRHISTRGLSDSAAIDSIHAQNGVAVVAHWFGDKHRTPDYYAACGADGFETVNQAEGIFYDRKDIEAIVRLCIQKELLMLGNADYHGYGSACMTWNALIISGWDDMDLIEKRHSIMEALRTGKPLIQVLVYNDRDEIPENRIFLSPLYNLTGYFRTLNGFQVLSWAVAVFLIAFLHDRFQKKGKRILRHDRLWGITGTVSSLVVLLTGAVLFMRSGPLSAHNEILREFGLTLLCTGAGFLVFSAVLLCTGRKKGSGQVQNEKGG